MLTLAGWLAAKVDVSFDPGPFFFSTIAAALVVTLVSMVVNAVLGGPSED
jgi:hypothetical protein